MGRTAIPSTRGLSTIDPRYGTGGVILDSGTTKTLFPNNAFIDIVTEVSPLIPSSQTSHRNDIVIPVRPSPLPHGPLPSEMTPPPPPPRALSPVE